MKHEEKEFDGGMLRTCFVLVLIEVAFYLVWRAFCG